MLPNIFSGLHILLIFKFRFQNMQFNVKTLLNVHGKYFLSAAFALFLCQNKRPSMWLDVNEFLRKINAFHFYSTGALHT